MCLTLLGLDRRHNRNLTVWTYFDLDSVRRIVFTRYQYRLALAQRYPLFFRQNGSIDLYRQQIIGKNDGIFKILYYICDMNLRFGQ